MSSLNKLRSRYGSADRPAAISYHTAAIVDSYADGLYTIKSQLCHEANIASNCEHGVERTTDPCHREEATIPPEYTYYIYTLGEQAGCAGSMGWGR